MLAKKWLICERRPRNQYSKLLYTPGVLHHAKITYSTTSWRNPKNNQNFSRTQSIFRIQSFYQIGSHRRILSSIHPDARTILKFGWLMSTNKTIELSRSLIFFHDKI